MVFHLAFYQFLLLHFSGALSHPNDRATDLTFVRVLASERLRDQ
ncbi:hypothetical protein NIES2104_45650 [Leptolyngbya sp. NIES-2104]|nr:hypothetical protein NIES2104_45650 [Leptolyngbya sp. NIES-2104]